MPKLKKAPPKSKSGKKVSQKILRQVASLPLRRSEDGKIEVLLVTSRETRRWIIPKGWPMKGKKQHEAAAIEAEEEAGVIGNTSKKAVGYYFYGKRRAGGQVELCRVSVYLLTAVRELDSWPEKNQRDSRWVSTEIAAEMVQEFELAELIRNIGATHQSID
jgi:8-oxo-dGTP pyrophosphatase MutT (NUDIX family)